MKKIKENKGITLIALIITIIVLIILAVVAINAVQGDGIIAHAKNARDDYQTAQEEENTILGNYMEKINKTIENEAKSTETELENQEVVLKNMQTQEQQNVKFADLIETLDTVIKIHEDGRAKRQEAEVELQNIEKELNVRLEELKSQGKLLEEQRLRERTMYDLEMLRETGFCHGIENYSRHIDGRKEGETPFTLFDYLTINCEENQNDMNNQIYQIFEGNLRN